MGETAFGRPGRLKPQYHVKAPVFTRVPPFAIRRSPAPWASSSIVYMLSGVSAGLCEFVGGYCCEEFFVDLLCIDLKY